MDPRWIPGGSRIDPSDGLIQDVSKRGTIRIDVGYWQDPEDAKKGH